MSYAETKYISNKNAAAFNKFQIINLALCCGYAPMVTKVSKTPKYQPEEKLMLGDFVIASVNGNKHILKGNGGIDVCYGNIPCCAIFLEKIKDSYNKRCLNNKKYTVPTADFKNAEEMAKLASVKNLNDIDGLGKLSPVEFLQNIIEAQQNYFGGSSGMSFYNKVRQNYQSAISNIAGLSWLDAREIAADLSGYQKIIESVIENQFRANTGKQTDKTSKEISQKSKVNIKDEFQPGE